MMLQDLERLERVHHHVEEPPPRRRRTGSFRRTSSTSSSSSSRIAPRFGAWLGLSHWRHQPEVSASRNIREKTSHAADAVASPSLSSHSQDLQSWGDGDAEDRLHNPLISGLRVAVMGAWRSSMEWLHHDHVHREHEHDAVSGDEKDVGRGGSAKRWSWESGGSRRSI